MLCAENLPCLKAGSIFLFDKEDTGLRTMALPESVTAGIAGNGLNYWYIRQSTER